MKFKLHLFFHMFSRFQFPAKTNDFEILESITLRYSLDQGCCHCMLYVIYNLVICGTDDGFGDQCVTTGCGECRKSLPVTKVPSNMRKNVYSAIFDTLVLVVAGKEIQSCVTQVVNYRTTSRYHYVDFFRGGV